jgi:hypothetical protein
MILFNDAEKEINEMIRPVYVTRDGFQFLNMRDAKEYISTHRECPKCKAIMEKYWVICKNCREKLNLEKYLTLPKKQWNFKTPIYSEVLDKYCLDACDLVELAYETFDDENLDKFLIKNQFVTTKAIYSKVIDPYEIYDVDEEEGTLPEKVIQLFDELNDGLEKLNSPLYYEPDEFAVITYEPKLSNWFRTSKYNIKK